MRLSVILEICTIHFYQTYNIVYSNKQLVLLNEIKISLDDIISTPDTFFI